MTRHPAAKQSVRLTIDHLVLHGVAPADRAAVTAALRSELTRLLSTADLGTGSRAVGSVAAVAAPSSAVASGSTSSGRHAAAALFGAIGKTVR